MSKGFILYNIFMIKKAVIPAAGLGTRFLPATIAQPKEMLTVVDKPVIQYVVEEAVEAGLKEILIVLGRNKRAIVDHFDPPLELKSGLEAKGKKSQLQLIKDISKLAKIYYVRQNHPKGLADAIYQAKAFVGKEPFAVLLGDTIIDKQSPVDLLQMVESFLKIEKSIVAVEKVGKEDISRYGIVDPQDPGKKLMKLKDLVEKPKVEKAPSDLAIASRYIFTSKIFELIEKTAPGVGGEVQITDSMRFLARNQALYAYKISGRRYDIGNKTDFVRANLDFGLKNPETKKAISAYLNYQTSSPGSKSSTLGEATTEE